MTVDQVKALKSELQASVAREQALMDEIEFLKRDNWLRRLYNNPHSKIGKVMRVPRTVYRIAKYPEVRNDVMGTGTPTMQPETPIKKQLNEGQLSLEPWLVDMETRIKALEDALSAGKKIALYYSEYPDASTFRYRTYNTYQATLKSKSWQSVYFFKEEESTILQMMNKADLVIIGRQTNYGKTLKRVINKAKSLAKPLILDIDDLVFDQKYLRMVLTTISQINSWDYWEDIFANNHKIAKQMDGFIVTNEFLGEKISECFDKPYRVIRNSLNREQQYASSAYAAIEKNDKEKFTIGYFSGSPTHAKDLEEALPEVVDFLADHEDAELVIAGMMDLSHIKNDAIHHDQIRFLPMTDFRKLQKSIMQVDVNIAPLVINDFTNCKSELKFYEAGAVKTTTIASPTFTFAKAITDGENGLLAQPGEWYDKIDYLYNHPKENAKIAERAYRYALKHYTGSEFLQEAEGAYGFFS